MNADTTPMSQPLADVESSKDQSQETSNSTVDEIETILQNNLNVDADVPAEYDLYIRYIILVRCPVVTMFAQ